MPIDFRCPNCGLETEVQDQYLGQSGACAGCGKTITVPYMAPSTGSSRANPRSSGLSLAVIIGLAFSGLLLAAVVLGLISFLLRPAFLAARLNTHRNACGKNLERIALALQAYHDQHGSYPPAYLADESGRPMHSWRVLLLPYLDESDLYQQYSFNVPWNDPQNMRLALQMPDVYGCPADIDAMALGETSYMVVTGVDTVFPFGDATKLAEVPDDPSSTILVVETQAAGVNWLNPTDLRFDRMQLIVGGQKGREITSVHADGAHAAFMDGSARMLTFDLSPEQLRDMLTIEQ